MHLSLKNIATLVSLLHGFTANAQSEDQTQDIGKGDNIVGDALDPYAFANIIVQFSEFDDGNQICINAGEALTRSWSNAQGVVAAVSIHVTWLPGGAPTVCGVSISWVAELKKLFDAWGDEAVTDGGTAWIAGNWGIELSYAKTLGQLKRDGTSSKLDKSFTPSAEQLQDPVWLASIVTLGNGTDHGPVSVTPPTSRRSGGALLDRATVNCGAGRLNGFTYRTDCVCNGQTYDVECATAVSQDGSWTRNVMNTALLNLINNIGNDKPLVGDTIKSTSPRGAALHNGWNGVGSYKPKGDRRQADCCRSAIQAIAGANGLPPAPSSCNCHVINTNWLMYTGASSNNDRIEL